jgi:hypothetical protein
MVFLWLPYFVAFGCVIYCLWMNYLILAWLICDPFNQISVSNAFVLYFWSFYLFFITIYIHHLMILRFKPFHFIVCHNNKHAIWPTDHFFSTTYILFFCLKLHHKEEALQKFNNISFIQREGTWGGEAALPLELVFFGQVTMLVYFPTTFCSHLL